MSIVGRLKEDLSTLGWRSTSRKTLRKIRTLVYSTETLRLMRLELGSLASDGDSVSDPSTTAVQLGFEDLVRQKVENALRLPEVIKARYRRGDRCWGVMAGTELVHVAWEASGRLPIDRECVIDTRPEMLGIYDMFTEPRHRGHGYQTFVLRAMCANAKQRGFGVAVAVVHPGNVPSLRAFTRTGFVAAGSVTRRIVLGVDRARPDGAAAAALR